MISSKKFIDKGLSLVRYLRMLDFTGDMTFRMLFFPVLSVK